MNNPDNISESLETIFGLKKKPGSGINIPDRQHCLRSIFSFTIRYCTCGEGTAASRILVEGEYSYFVEFLLILHATAAAGRGD
jgi:hypothetical protein